MNTPTSAIAPPVILLLAMIACNTPTMAAQTPSTAQLPPTGIIASTTPPAPVAVTPEIVTFKSGELTLEGYLFKPPGDGPFPALIWNHGSDKDPKFDNNADFVPEGYVVFGPVRRGHGDSQGEYIADSIKQAHDTKGPAASAQLMVKLMETEQLDDQLAGLAYLKSLPYVDVNRLGVIGCSYGGIQTLLAAERGAGYKAAVAISPAAESWKGNKFLQQRLIKAVSGISIPVFIIHPAKDVSLEPGKVLGAEFERLGKPFQLKIYPPIGTDAQQSHCFGGAQAKGTGIWLPDVLAFFSQYLK